jgi:hypothetical protein
MMDHVTLRKAVVLPEHQGINAGNYTVSTRMLMGSIVNKNTEFVELWVKGYTINGVPKRTQNDILLRVLIRNVTAIYAYPVPFLET